MAPPLYSPNCEPTAVSVRHNARTLAKLGCAKTSKQDSVTCRAVREDEEDTDTGSSGSDPESSCSSSWSAELNDLANQKTLRHCIRKRTGQRDTSLPRQRALVPPRGRFGGTPLSPIPGTPVAESDKRFSFAMTSDNVESVTEVQAALAASLEDASRAQPVPVNCVPLRPQQTPRSKASQDRPVAVACAARGGAVGHTTAAPVKWQPLQVHANKLRREGAVVLEQLRREAEYLPQKVEVPPHVGQPTRLDPMRPAKKRPPFPEYTKAFDHLQASQPVKKWVTEFLTAEPPCNTFGFGGFHMVKAR